ncbi:MAG: DUF1499 domain-containing protein [Acidobacteriota bacterium]
MNTTEDSSPPHRPVSTVAVLGLTLALVCGAAAVLAGFGTRWNWWTFPTGLTLFRWAARGAVAAAVLSLAGCIAARPASRRRGLAWAVAGLVLGLLVSGTAWNWSRIAALVPPIHDITTDTENPPQFVAVLPLRSGARNPAEYGGPEVAAQQRKAYPDLTSANVAAPPAEAFRRALAAAREMGWDIVDANEAEGRIEATDTTFWFGFKDDIVVRVSAAGGGSRIDVRSVSRVGKSDVGTNAKRIRKYLGKLPR